MIYTDPAFCIVNMRTYTHRVQNLCIFTHIFFFYRLNFNNFNLITIIQTLTSIINLMTQTKLNFISYVI